MMMKKGIVQMLIPLVIILGALAAIYFYQAYENQSLETAKTSLSILPFEVAPTCRIIKPTWGFYKCEKSSVENSIPKIIQTSGSNSGYGWFRCDYSDVAGTYQACRFYVDQLTTSENKLYYKICSGDPCDITSTTDITGTLTARGQEIKINFGQVITFMVQGYWPGWNTYSAQITEAYYKKQLIYHDWFGYESLTKGIGCDIRAILPSTDWNKLPKDSKTSLQMDERQNFIVGYIDLPVLGNYFTHPTYGDVVCTQQHQLYKIKLYQTATDPNTIGTYTTQNNVCYYTTEANSVANVECCPGETLTGYTCSNEGKLVPVDKGVCVRGGISSAQLCPGGGGYYCDITTHKAWASSTCDVNTGNCISQGQKYASCCPPSTGCAGDQYCDAVDYTCKAKPSGVIACPYECCPSDWASYQTKLCSSNKKCCNGVCKDSCEGVNIYPPTPPSDTKTCYEQCDAKAWTDPTKLTAIPCKAECWVKAKWTEIVIGALAAIFVFIIVVSLFGIVGLVVGIIISVAIFILTLIEIWVGGIILFFALVIAALKIGGII
jgi:hypothetical protein